MKFGLQVGYWQKNKRAKQVHIIIQSPSAFGAINVSVILQPHHPRNGQLIQPHPRALDQVPQPVASFGKILEIFEASDSNLKV